MICLIILLLFILLKIAGKIDWSWWIIIFTPLIGLGILAALGILSFLLNFWWVFIILVAICFI